MKDIRIVNEDDKPALTEEEQEELAEWRGLAVHCASTMFAGTEVSASVVIENANILLDYILTGETGAE